MNSPTPLCPFLALLEKGLSGDEDLEELFAHLAIGCSQCLPRVPPALLQALGFPASARQTGLFSGRGLRTTPHRLTEEQVDRWFVHRSRAAAPPALAAILALPPQARLYRLLTDEWIRSPEAVSALRRCLDSLVLTQPRDAVAVAQAGLVFAAGAPPEALPRAVGQDLYLQAIRASAELALRRGDRASLEHYSGWLLPLWSSCAEPYDQAETANTYALVEVLRGALSDAISLLIEASQEIEEAGDPRFSGHLLTNAATVALLDGRATVAETWASKALARLSAGGAEDALIANARYVRSLAAAKPLGSEPHPPDPDPPAAETSPEICQPDTETVH